jgi:hypothetical protein
MKGSNEFMYFLVGGLVLIAVMMLFFGTEVCDDKNGTGPGIIEAVKTFSIPDLRAANVIETVTSDGLDKRIYNGLLFGEDKLVYDISKTGLQNVIIKFRVSETNGLGKLLVSVNGVALHSNMTAPGNYQIAVPAELISDHMIIEIFPESSYWRIWAPTVYDLRGVSIAFTSYASEASQFKFYLGEEYLNLEFAKVDIVLSENVGNLIVDLNGRTVWSSPVANEQSIIMEKSDLRLGDNIIKFRSSQGSRFDGRGTIVVIFLTRFPETLNQTGIVTAVQPMIGSTNQFYGYA